MLTSRLTALLFISHHWHCACVEASEQHAQKALACAGVSSWPMVKSSGTGTRETKPSTAPQPGRKLFQTVTRREEQRHCGWHPRFCLFVFVFFLLLFSSVPVFSSLWDHTSNENCFHNLLRLESGRCLSVCPLNFSSCCKSIIVIIQPN